MPFFSISCVRIQRQLPPTPRRQETSRGGYAEFLSAGARWRRRRWLAAIAGMATHP